MSCNLKDLLTEFMKVVDDGTIEVYNEFSLQHELGCYLRKRLPVSYKVQFERNSKFFGIGFNGETTKHEIDIVIFNDSERFAIELKYPLNGQYPELMYSFINDIKFMEEMKNSGFKETYCLILVEDKNYYSGRKKAGIYGYFRDNQTIHGRITKPTGKNREDQFVIIGGYYNIIWKPCAIKNSKIYGVYDEINAMYSLLEI